MSDNDNNGTFEPTPEPAGKPELTPGVEVISLVDEMQRSFLAYSMSVIVSRALPDVRDGLKPVHRRILYGSARLTITLIE